jgi:hypothetical protein
MIHVEEALADLRWSFLPSPPLEGSLQSRPQRSQPFLARRFTSPEHILTRCKPAVLACRGASGPASVHRDAPKFSFAHFISACIGLCSGTQTHRHTDAQTHRHTDTHTDRQTDRHRHTDTQTHRHTTHRHRHRHTDTNTHIWPPMKPHPIIRESMQILESLTSLTVYHDGAEIHYRQ